MFEKIRKLKDRKGFTLVELIVVMVMLASLAALLIPALTGYIDKANKAKVVAETRSVAMAAQTIISETYGQGKLATTDANPAVTHDDIAKLAEANDSWSFKVYVSKADGKVGQVEAIQLWDGTYGCLYIDGAYYVKGDKDVPTTVTGATVPTAVLDNTIVWAASAD